MSRTIPTKYHIKKNKAQGEMSLPFDLAIHRYDAVCKLIENNFEDYVNPKYFHVASDGVIEHTKYFVRYTHEKDDVFYERNFSYLIDKYTQRIESFRNYMSDNNILFISTFPLYPNELVSNIKSQYPQLKFKLLNFDIRPFSEHDTYRVKDVKLEDEVVYIRAPIPYEGYIWWKKDHFNTNAGQEFERYFSYWTKMVWDFGMKL